MSKLREFSHHIHWQQLPVYICLVGIITWLGILTLIVLAEHGVAPAKLDALANGIGLLALLVAASPFINPTVALAAERFR